MDYSKLSLTIIISVIYFYLFQSPQIIKYLKINIKDNQYIIYTFIYALVLYISLRGVNYITKTDITEHFNYDRLINILSNKIDNSLQKSPTLNKECKKIKDNYIQKIKTDENLKNYLDEYGLLKCKEQIDKKKLCHKLDMSKYILKNTIPDCSKVIPQQYGLFKHGDSKDSNDSTDKIITDSIINSNNYIIFYLLFVLLLVIYVVIVIISGIFSK